MFRFYFFQKEIKDLANRLLGFYTENIGLFYWKFTGYKVRYAFLEIFLISFDEKFTPTNQQNRQKTHVMESDFCCNETHVRLITIDIALHHMCF